VVIGSFLPGSWKRELGTHPYTLSHAVSLQHRAVHFVTFGLTTLLFLMLAERPKDWAKGIAGAVLLGLAIEAGQYAVGLSRVLEWWDLRDDVLAVAGATVVFGVAGWLMPRRAKP
jgi:heme A synthase